jgi:hypothetical protein
MWGGDMKDIFIVVFATLSVCFAVSYLIVLRQSVKLKRDLAKLFIEKTQKLKSSQTTQYIKNTLLSFYLTLVIGHINILKMFKKD